MNRPRAHFPVSASVTGVDYTDYLTNDHDGFQKSLGITRKQSDERDISCIAFDPKCSWTSWFYYYEKQLRSCIYEYASRKQKSYLEALQECSRRIAILELVPYYSERATKIDPFVFIPSAQVAIHAARDLEESEKVTMLLVGMVQKTGGDYGTPNEQRVLLAEDLALGERLYSED